MVAQGDQRIAGQGGEEFDLEQLEADHRVGPGGLEARHQLIDALAGDREVLEQDRRVLVAGGEHGVVAILAFAPQAELGAQAVVLAGRVEHLRLGGVERRQQGLQAGLLLGKLGGVRGRIKLGHRSLVGVQGERGRHQSE
ncbi:hypothetical protein D3C72_1485940 [compost metagenome]